MRLVRGTIARLRRLHPCTWLVVLMVTITMVVIVVPGVASDRDETSPWYAESRKQLHWDTAAKYQADARQLSTAHRTTIWIYDHGWPWPFMLRSLGSLDTFTATGPKQSRDWSKPLLEFQGAPSGTSTGTPLEVAWSSRDSWPLESEFYRFRFGVLLLDCLAALLVVIGVAALAEAWVRWRGGLFRFRVHDLLIVSTLFSVTLAWYYHHLRISEKEGNVVQSMTKETWIRGAEQRYAGPKWLARLAGNQELLPFLYHYDSVQWHDSRAVQDYDSWQREFDAVRKLRYLRTVTLPESVPLELVEQLAAEHRLKTFAFEFDNVDSRQFQAGDTLLVQAHRLELLEVLGIRHLQLGGENVLASDIETVASLPTISRLTLHDVSATVAEIEATRHRHPDVEILATWGPYHTKEPAAESTQKRVVQRSQAARQAAREEAIRLASTDESPPEDDEANTALSAQLIDEVRRTIEGQ